MRLTTLAALTTTVSMVLTAVPASATFTWGVIVRTPMVGIAPGQVARFYAVFKNPGPAQTPERNPGPSQCDGTLTIVNGDGLPLTSSASVTLTPGLATFIDLPFDGAVAGASDLSAPGAFRVMVRGIANFDCIGKDPGPVQKQPGPIQVSLEMFDVATGAAQVLVQPGPNQKNPGPISTPMFGVAAGQVARFSAVMKQPGPVQCDADLSFVGGDGVTLATMRATMDPDHAIFFDLPFDAAAGDVNGAQRLMVGATGDFVCKNPGPPSDPSKNPGPTQKNPGPIQISVEVFDAATGVAQVTVGPGPQQ